MDKRGEGGNGLKGKWGVGFQWESVVELGAIGIGLFQRDKRQMIQSTILRNTTPSPCPCYNSHSNQDELPYEFFSPIPHNPNAFQDLISSIGSIICLLKMIIISYYIISFQMQKPNQQNYIDKLLSDDGQEVIDAEIREMAKDMDKDQYEQFVKQYFSKQPKGHKELCFNQRPQQQACPSQQSSSQPQLIDTETPSLQEQHPHYEVLKQPLSNNKYRITYNNGDVYEGQIQNNQKNGWGIYSYSNGQKYDGFFVEDEIHGFGKYTFMSGAEYDGEWFQGMKNGFGTLTFANNDRYIGNFRDDNMEGKGKYVSSNGDVFQGIWREGRKHGRGEFNGADGRVIIGEWVNDKFTV